MGAKLPTKNLCDDCFPGHMHQWQRRSYRKRLFRTNPVCQICKQVIDSFDEATLDHIVPKSKGGRSEYSNLQLAHSACNNEKGNKFEFQPVNA